MTGPCLTDLAWRTRSLSADEKLVLLRLIHQAGEWQTITKPNEHNLATDCGATVPRFRAIVKSLSKRGVVKLERGSAGSSRAVIWQLAERALAELQPPANAFPPADAASSGSSRR